MEEEEEYMSSSVLRRYLGGADESREAGQAVLNQRSMATLLRVRLW